MSMAGNGERACFVAAYGRASLPAMFGAQSHRYTARPTALRLRAGPIRFISGLSFRQQTPIESNRKSAYSLTVMVVRNCTSLPSAQMKRRSP